MKLVLFLILLFTFSFAQAATVVCSGTVDKIAMHANDKMLVKLSSINTHVFVCSFDKAWTVTGTNYQTSPDTCKAMLSMFMHAKSTGANINSLYFDGDQVPENCGSFNSWSSANIRYVVY